MNHRTTDAAALPNGHPGSEMFCDGRLEFVETLSLREQFRLVEIAHETSSVEIRDAAMKVLQKYLNPLVRFVVPSKD